MVKLSSGMCMLLVTAALMIAGCSSIKELNGTKELDIKKEPDRAIEDQETQSRFLEYQVDYYQRYFKALIESADQQEYIKLSKNLYQYRLVVDNKEFPGNGEIVVENTDFKLCLSEEMLDIYGLPADMFILGHITNQNEEYNSHLQIDSPVPYDMYPGSGTTVSGYNYYFENVPEGTVINLTITPELSERLGLQTRQLKIITATGTQSTKGG